MQHLTDRLDDFRGRPVHADELSLVAACQGYLCAARTDLIEHDGAPLPVSGFSLGEHVLQLPVDGVGQMLVQGGDIIYGEPDRQQVSYTGVVQLLAPRVQPGAGGLSVWVISGHPPNESSYVGNPEQKGSGPSHHVTGEITSGGLTFEGAHRN